MWNIHQTPKNGYIFSQYGDILVFAFPIAFSFVVLPFLYLLVPEDKIPLWAYLLVVALTDVGHVWSTLFRCYFDSEENSRKSFLYNATPILLFQISFCVHYFLSEGTFWTLLGYLAIFHFIRQQFGFLMLAKRRGKDFQNMKRDKLFLYAGFLFPFLLWHADRTRNFDWFNRTDQFLHFSVFKYVKKVLKIILLDLLPTNSTSTTTTTTTKSSSIPLGRWSSHLFMEEQQQQNQNQQENSDDEEEEEYYYSNNDENYQQESSSSSSSNNNFGDFSSSSILEIGNGIPVLIYGLCFLFLVGIVVYEQYYYLQKQKQHHDENGDCNEKTTSEDEEEEETTCFPYYSTKHMLLLGTWITWFFGVLCPHRVVALTFLNLFHAFPTFLIVFCVSFNRWLLAARNSCSSCSQKTAKIVESFAVSEENANANLNSETKKHSDDEETATTTMMRQRRGQKNNTNTNTNKRVVVLPPSSSFDTSSSSTQLSSSTVSSATTITTSSASSSYLDRFALWILLGCQNGIGVTSPFVETLLQESFWKQNCNINIIKKEEEEAEITTKKHQKKISSSFFFTMTKIINNNRKLFQFFIFMMFLFILGLAEEFLWEGLIWQDYTASYYEFDPTIDFHPMVYSVITSLLILPQATHYFLDAFLWKFSKEENPGLELFMCGAERIPQEWFSRGGK